MTIRNSGSGLIAEFSGASVLFGLFRGNISGSINTTTGAWGGAGEALLNLGNSSIAGISGNLSFTVGSAGFSGTARGRLTLLGQLMNSDFTTDVRASDGYFEFTQSSTFGVTGLLSAAGFLQVRVSRLPDGTVGVRVDVQSASGSLYGGVYDVTISGFFDASNLIYQLVGNGVLNLGTSDLALISGTLSFVIDNGAFSGAATATLWLFGQRVWDQQTTVRAQDGYIEFSGSNNLWIPSLGPTATSFVVRSGGLRSINVTVTGSWTWNGISTSLSGTLDTATNSYVITGSAGFERGVWYHASISGSVSFELRDGIFTGRLLGNVYVLGQLLAFVDRSVAIDLNPQFTINANLRVGPLSLVGSLSVRVHGLNVEIEVDRDNPLKVQLAGFIETSFNGYMSSSRGVYLNGSARIEVGSIHFGFSGQVNLTFDGSSLHSTIVGNMVAFGVQLGSVSETIEIGTNPLTFRVHKIFGVFGTTLDATFNASIGPGYFSANFSGLASMFGGGLLVAVNGNVSSGGVWSVYGEAAFTLGDCNLGANGKFILSFGNNYRWVVDYSRFNPFTGYSHYELGPYFHLTVQGEAYAGVWLAGHFVGARAALSGEVDSSGNFGVSLSAGITVVDVGRPEWVWWWPFVHYPHTVFVGTTFTVNFAFSGGLRLWKSQVEGGKVYFTKNLDGSVGATDPAVVQDQNGNLVFQPPAVEINNTVLDLNPFEEFDRDGDGIVEEEEGLMLVRGGHDVDTKEENNSVLRLVNYSFEDFAPFGGATIWLDADDDGELDDNEISLTTEDDGYFDFYETVDGWDDLPELSALGVFERFDTNKDGKIGPDEGEFVVVDGAHIETLTPISTPIPLDMEISEFGTLEYRDATLFLDLNGDLILNSGEFWTKSDEDGFFVFFDAEYFLSGLIKYDKNFDGRIDDSEGVLMIQGGRRVVTGDELIGVTKLPEVRGDGYTDYKGATVFLDLDHDQVFDDGEPSTLTESDGWYYFALPDELSVVSGTQELAGLDLRAILGSLLPFDTNKNGQIDPNEGVLKARGGVEIGQNNAVHSGVKPIDIRIGFGSILYRDARVFLDLYGDDTLDPQEPYTSSDSEGWFDFEPTPAAELEKFLGLLMPFDINQNGVIESEEGTLRVKGGTSLVSGLPNDVSDLPGIVLSGYLDFRGADAVFLDVNNNRLLDTGEVFVRPTSSNFFSFQTTEANNALGPLANFDTNKNGRLDPTEGVFVVTGGRDVHANLEDEVIVRQLGDGFGDGVSDSINPLSNLKVSMVAWWGVDPSEADLLISRALGLPPGVNFNNLDPIADPIGNTLPLGIAAQSSMTLLDLASLLTASNPDLDELSAQVNVSDAIADEIILEVLRRLKLNDIGQLPKNSDGLYTGLADSLNPSLNDIQRDAQGRITKVTSVVDLSDPEFLLRVIQTAAEYTGTDVGSLETVAVVETLSAKNRRVAQWVEQGIDKPLVAFARFKALTQLETRPSIRSMVAGDLDPEVYKARFTGESLANELLRMTIQGGNLTPWIGSVPSLQMPGNSIGELEVHLDDLDNAIGSLILSVTSDNAAVVDASMVQVLGTGSERVIKITSGAVEGVAKLTITVSDGVATRAVQVTVDTRFELRAVKSMAEHDGKEMGLSIGSDAKFVESRASGLRDFELVYSHDVDPKSLNGALLRVSVASGGDVATQVSGIVAQLAMGSDQRTVRITLSESLPDNGVYRFELLGITDLVGNGITTRSTWTAGALKGDVNGDGKVDNGDVSAARGLVGANITSVLTERQIRADINGDGKSDAQEVRGLLALRGQSVLGLVEFGQYISLQGEARGIAVQSVTAAQTSAFGSWIRDDENAWGKTRSLRSSVLLSSFATQAAQLKTETVSM